MNGLFGLFIFIYIHFIGVKALIFSLPSYYYLLLFRSKIIKKVNDENVIVNIIIISSSV